MDQSFSRRAGLLSAAALFSTTAIPGAAAAQQAACTPPRLGPPVVYNRTITIDGVDIFYREAGPVGAPVVLLLHGFPTSSHMFRRLIPALAERYHVIAPDYPGFGQSAAPDHAAFAYTFARYADLMDSLLSTLGVRRYAVYSFDYGAPVSYRLALKHPERVAAFIVQNGNAYEEGLQAFWDPVKAYWADGSPERRLALEVLVAPETTRLQYYHGVHDASRVDPDAWRHDQVLLDRPGNREIQLDLFYDYRTNVALYPRIQAYFRRRQPPMLIVWGKNDVIFPEAGARPYLRDLPNAEYHMLDTGHFALEDKLDAIEPLIQDFLGRVVAG